MAALRDLSYVSVVTETYLISDRPMPEPMPATLAGSLRMLPEGKCLEVRGHSMNSVRATASKLVSECRFDRSYKCQEAEEEPGLIFVWRQLPRNKG